jgi:hypothetical protein
MTEAEFVLASLKGSLPNASDESLQAAIKDWSLYPHMDGGEMTGVKMIKGTEFHFVSGAGFKMDRKNLRESMREHVEKHGFLTTRLQHGDKDNERFNKLFGFKKTWADENFQYFILTDLPFGKGQSCQQ